MKEVTVFLICLNLFSREFDSFLKLSGMGLDFDIDYLSMPNTFVHCDNIFLINLVLLITPF